MQSKSRQNAPAVASAATRTVQVHASVLLSVLDHHMRKPSTSTRVIGTLLGFIHPNGVLEVTSSYAVPHVEKEREVAIGKDFNRQMRTLALKSNAAGEEQVLGWYATTQSGSELVDAKSCLIHDYYSTGETGGSPLHLVVDLARNAAMTAFYSVALASSPTATKALAAEFRPLHVETVASAPERIALAALGGKQQNLTQTEAVDRLLALLDKAATDLPQSTDPALGQRIADLLTRVDLPTSTPASEEFAKSLQDAIQDLTIVLQLSQLTKAQLAIGEKLSAVI